jgi:hypothetical protein
MGQNNWAWGCALLLLVAFGRHAVAQQPADPFGDVVKKPGSSPESEKRPHTSGNASDSPEDARERIESVLNQRLKEPLDFIEQPLSDVATILAETYDIPILFDTAALDAVAASPDLEVSVQIANVTLRSALDLMLKNAGAEALTYIIDNEVLLITTLEEAETRLEVIVYRVDDLIADPAMGDSRFDAADFDTLIDVIVSSVDHESWQENGKGEGEIHAFPPGMIVISQTSRVHEQVQRLLRNLRSGKTQVEEKRAGEREAAAKRPMTRAIRVYDASLAEPQNRKVIQQALQQSVDWKADGDEVAEDDVFLHVLQDRVLVRHLPAVVRQVEVAIREIAPPIPGMYGGGGGGGRGGGGMGGRGGF